MKTQTIKRFSFLGLVLLGASAVTAAIIPSKESDSSLEANGIQIPSTVTANQANTCIPADDVVNCHYTVTAAASDGVGSSSTRNGGAANSITVVEDNATGTGTTLSGDIS